jgi:HipA-like C-terminal domain
MDHAITLRATLAKAPASATTLTKVLGISQPTLSRALGSMGTEIVRIGRARSIQYALRDNFRGLSDFPIYQVGADGTLKLLGSCVAVRPEGYVVQFSDGTSQHSEGLPWWLVDMRPQGFLGRAYAHQHSAALGLPPKVSEWSDAQAIRALLSHGADAVGNLLLGDSARDRFLTQSTPTPLPLRTKGKAYARLAGEALNVGDTWSSAAGEQPKFCTYAQTAQGPAHVLVKFSSAEANPVAQRWRDLLWAEHAAMRTLRDAGINAAHTAVIDYAGQRFLEVLRFDRVDTHGRRGLFSLAAMDAEFVGDARSPWPVLTASLARQKVITRQAAEDAALLYAFGVLIGNDDMHSGNLSFMGDLAPPYALAPAYDMLPMAFRPGHSGTVGANLPPAYLHASVPNAIWVKALGLAHTFLVQLHASSEVSEGFKPCVAALKNHLETASRAIGRLDTSGA